MHTCTHTHRDTHIRAHSVALARLNPLILWLGVAILSLLYHVLAHPKGPTTAKQGKGYHILFGRLQDFAL